MATGIETGILDYSADGVAIQGIRELSRDAVRAGVAVKDLSKLTQRLGQPIIARARQLAPKGKTKGIYYGFRNARSKNAVRVHIGTEKRLPYAAVRHWGLPGQPMPLWLSKAEKELRDETFAGFGEGLIELLRENGW